MRLFLVAVIALVIGLVQADQRQKRQAAYAGYNGGTYDGGSQQYQRAQAPQAYQPQPQGYANGPQVQHYPAQPPIRPQPARQQPARQLGAAPDEEEKEEGPHPLQLLLEKSKFDCAGKSDGYYADSDVGCQAFHYCVTGQKHSMMCPAGTVFHQVHLNCVAEDQDICSKADKFYFVNNYLNKPLEQRGPNNTVQYHQRYYPEGYAVGDPFVPPQEANRDQRQQQQPPAATYGLGPAYREQSPQPQPAYQQVAQAHRPQPAAHRPAQSAPYASPQPQHYAPPQSRPAPAYQLQAAPRPQPAQPAAYGYGAQQEQVYQSQAAQAQRAYNQHQYQAAAPQQQLYPQGTQRQRYQ